MITTTEELKKFKQNLILGMKLNFKEHGQLDAVALILDSTGQMLSIATPYTSQAEKEMAMAFVRNTAKEKNAIAVALINEAWAFTSKSESEHAAAAKQKEERGSLEHVDGRKEIAILYFETRHSKESTTFDIDKVNRKLINEQESTSTNGMFANLLS